jgi:hypothetical protein
LPDGHCRPPCGRRRSIVFLLAWLPQPSVSWRQSSMPGLARFGRLRPFHRPARRTGSTNLPQGRLRLSGEGRAGPGNQLPWDMNARSAAPSGGILWSRVLRARLELVRRPSSSAPAPKRFFTAWLLAAKSTLTALCEGHTTTTPTFTPSSRASSGLS